ncbi:MAG TPA: hypothetical protein DDZ81_23585 [Acetobacteraceae bacterium]|jgi:peptidoglycan/LPS O-acetylase OafA/YrhL|nr:hypothetical protein [Acetobacteraceae bacterium]
MKPWHVVNREVSLYLDIVRFGAAFVVFGCHIGAWSFGGFLWRLVPYGSPAVVVFFVLSGYVIGYVSQKRETTVTDYIVARAARMYSVTIPVLFIGALIDGVGSMIEPGFYSHISLWFPHELWQLPIYLTFLNRVWSLDFTPGSIGAYWSLSYEAAYYALFGVCFFLRGTKRMAGAAFIFLIVGPRILAMSPLWFSGLVAYRIGSKQPLDRAAGWVVFIVSLVAAVVWNFWSMKHGILQSGVNIPEHGISGALEDFLIAAIFSLNLIAFNTISSSFQGLANFIVRPVRWLAGGTFTLYLLHQPLLAFAKAVCVEWVARSAWFHAAILILPLWIVFLVAEWTERRKAIWQKLFREIASKISPGSTQVSSAPAQGR